MAVTLKEQIFLNVVARLETITTANGYELDIKRVHRVPEGSPDLLKEYPSLNVVDRGSVIRRMSQLVNEHRLDIEVEAYTREYVEDTKIQEMERLLGDVKKAMFVDPTFSDLVIRTFLSSGGNSAFAMADPHAMNRVTFTLIFRESRTNPYVQVVT